MVALPEPVMRGYDYLNSLFSGFPAELIITVVIVLIGFVVGRLVARILNLLLHALDLDKSLKKGGVKFSLESTISLLAAYVIYIATIIIALERLRLTSTVVYVITGGAIVLIVIATLLGLRDFIPNFFAGLYLFRQGTLQVGDHVRVAGVEGKIVRMSIIESEIETQFHDLMIVPNSLLAKTLIVKKK